MDFQNTNENLNWCEKFVLVKLGDCFMTCLIRVSRSIDGAEINWKEVRK